MSDGRGAPRMRTEVHVPTPDGARLWIAVEGSGPPVVMCHGGPGLWDYLGNLAEMLSDEFTVYRWDQRACGRSTAGSASASTEQTLEDLDQLRLYFGHDKWSVLGHSWGAELALLYGLLFETRSTSVVYVSGRGTQRWWQATGRAANRANVARHMTHDQVERLSTLSQLATRSVGEEVEFRRLSWMTDFIEPDGNDSLRTMSEAPFSINLKVNRALASDQVLSDDALQARCAGTRLPMLFVHGAEDPRPVEGPEQLAKLISTAAMKIVPHASHLPWVEQPDVVRDALKSFLRRATAA